MDNAKHIGRNGAVASALGVGNFRHTATRMTVSIGVAVLVVMATAVPTPASTVSPAVRLAASTACRGSTETTCALIMGTTTIPTPTDFYIDAIKNQYIAPTHPNQDIEYVAVTTPQEVWPLTGILRLAILGLQQLDPHLAEDKGLAWPDEPWWKLSGLFDLTFDQANRAGLADLETAMTKYGNDDLVIYGYGQSAVIANMEKQRLAEQYPGPDAPDIDFVVGGDFNLPNGGLFARFPGLYIPIVDLSFNGPAPTDTQFRTDVIIRQYDGVEDFPLYPLNLVADLNALLGAVYVGLYGADVSLAPDASKSPAIQSRDGDSTYYFFETQDLPLFGPLRTLGVPESLIDVVEPFFRVIVELGYDRSIPPWEPTPARLIPTLDPVKVATDLINAVGEGINNAAALLGAPASLRIPATPAIADPDDAVEQDVSAGTTLKRIIGDVNDGVAQGFSAVRSQLPAPPAVTQDDVAAGQRTTGRELAATRDQIHRTLGAVKSVLGNGRTIVRSAVNDNGSSAATATTGRKTPVRDAVKKTGGDIKKVVTKVSNSAKKALRDRKHGHDGTGVEGQ